ncbi:MAG: CDP-alcohol phosphatidyltransferase family protein [Candidatus Nanopelagicales bacterium]|jgi:phosphatidylglycerophosphate synthase|nr:CDP-alcohol phosphatidyltransferase family protein [Candidatus Nanopelagicales bacterium]MDP4746469.1 CDP-alcohol phosphatidyltransferase family protein [Candidatus Nanopelagicales bacterium]
MTNYSIAHIKSVGQPPEVLNRRVAEHWSGPLYMRKISPYLSKFLLSIGLSPTMVTWLMVFSGWLAAASVLKTGLIGVILAVVFAQLQMLFDCCDGEMARVTQKYNPAGIFIDRFGHYSTEALLAIAFGIRVFLENEESISAVIYGLILALLITFNKVFNDMVHVARSFSNLARLSEDKDIAVPRNKLLAMIRSIFRFFPIHKIYHSIELSFIILISAIFGISQNLLVLLTIAAFITVVGHLVAILTSARLRG